MTGWQLEPANIGKALTDTDAHVQAVATALKGATDAGEPLANGAGFDGVVIQALAGFFQEQSAARLQPMLNRYGSVLEATANATNAFLAGDEQMASTTIAQAGNAATVAGKTGLSGGK